MSRNDMGGEGIRKGAGEPRANRRQRAGFALARIQFKFALGAVSTVTSGAHLTY